MKPTPTTDLPPVDQFPWWAVRAAYGPPKQMPQWVRDLESADEDIWEDAVNDGLWSWLLHQYTLYSSTPYAIPYVAEVAPRAQPEVRLNILRFLKHCAERDRTPLWTSPVFVVVRWSRGIPRLTLRSAVLRCHPVIQELLNDGSKETRELAQWLDNYCQKHTLGLRHHP